MSRRSTQRFADMSQASVPERLDFIKAGAIFETSARRAFKDHLKDMVIAPTPSDEKLVFLTGPAGMGLSSLLAEFSGQFPLAAHGETGLLSAPVINEHIHPSGEIIDYCDELRASLAIPGYGPMVRQVSFQKTLHLLGALNTRVVILEDFHQTYNFKKHQMVAYQNFVHHLISKYDIRVVLSGAPQIWRWAMDDE
ncbi:TniB family NTP-binding protein [Pseudaestuariivita rosea]|uniref:TniB family NTP-binding protein n=1 Tax=Pseudaestuariivita rosea TaxID=2763263 RepID=UPI001ABB8B48|nr:TniB family NTP-binding protein [Pseudaestuariivita rosea]